jgi:uncharacterized protein YjbJ (UPF0337 family)
MNWKIVAAQWNQFKGAIRAKWPKLSEQDLAYIAGSRDTLCAEIQQLYLITEDEAEGEIDEFLEAQEQLQGQDTDPMQATKRPAPHTPSYR